MGSPGAGENNIERLTEYFDDLASAPYLLNPNAATYGFITHDNPSSTAAEVHYALNKSHLSGVFMWELSKDYNGRQQPLLNAMNSAFAQSSAVDTDAVASPH